MKTKKRHALIAIIIALAIGFAAGFLASAQSAPGAESVDAKLGRVLADFHNDNSGHRIYDIFDDATLLFEEPKNETTVFKYIYLPSANRTVVSCDRNATIAICPGRMERFLDVGHVGECFLHPTVTLMLVNYTGG